MKKRGVKQFVDGSVEITKIFTTNEVVFSLKVSKAECLEKQG